MIDRVTFYINGGNGGNGMVSFRREKFIPYGGPNGGDGGNGGNVILVADPSKTTLSDLRHQKHYRAENGGDGKGKDQHGKKGGNLIIHVPAGTIVRHKFKEQQIDLGDLTKGWQELVVAKGGKGGRGNKYFATAIKQAPKIAQDGDPGERRELVLDLKLLADVGLVGRPNVGKSTLINAVTSAKSKVADYPFTTLEPKLGVVETGFKSFVIADIPGLIEGAHVGRGLGYNFLRHIERTRVLIHIIDGDTVDPAADLDKINDELFLFNSELKNKPQIIAINKIDIPEVLSRLPQIKSTLANAGFPLLCISAATGEGLRDLINKAVALLDETSPVQKKAEINESKQNISGSLTP